MGKAARVLLRATECVGKNTEAGQGSVAGRFIAPSQFLWTILLAHALGHLVLRLLSVWLDCLTQVLLRQFDALDQKFLHSTIDRSTTPPPAISASPAPPFIWNDE